MKLVVAEKPSVGRDLARILGAKERRDGALAGGGYVVTWCVGHLVELVEPETYDPGWKRWSFTALPMLPERFRLRPVARSGRQWTVVRALLGDRSFEGVINACDAGREGELIFRYVYELAGARLPVERLWISSLTPEAIRDGFARLRPGRDFDALADAARARSEADWLVGLNATRAMTLATEGRGVRSIGRVQTPTLALLVDRDDAIRRFVPRDFWELGAKVEAPSRDVFSARWTTMEGSTRLATRALAEALEARVEAAGEGTLTVAEVREKATEELPPPLFDLTSLQRAANQRFGFSADRTLSAAQALYERHKLITYPRTASRHLGEDQRAKLSDLVASFVGHPDYDAFARRLSGAPLPITKRIIDDAEVSDHHAIIPTGGRKRPEGLGPDERKVYDLVVRRFLAAFFPPARFSGREIVLVAGPRVPGRPKQSSEARDRLLEALPPPPDRFLARGRAVLDPGWQQVEPPRRTDDAVLPEVTVGARLPARTAVTEGRTRPPPHHTDASLLAAMETAGRDVDDEALREAMKACGLGTPATRASILETLIARGYVRRDGKALVVTEQGFDLVARLPVPTLRSAELTGEWEARLQGVAAGRERAEGFMQDVRRFVAEIVETTRAMPAGSSAPAEPEPLGSCPRCQAAVTARGSSFACTACPFSVPGWLAGRALDAAEVRALLAGGRTEMLSGFRSKKKRRFRAALTLVDGELEFVFPARRGRRGSAMAAGRSERGSGGRSGHRSARGSAAPPLEALRCPRCGRAGLVAGRRAWGCAHWREGCDFTVPFVVEDKKLTPKELEDLIRKGKTRKAAFGSGKGRLHLEEGRPLFRHDP